MVGKTPEPLTPEAAKAQLRSAAREASLSAWIKRQPYQVMLLALAAGVILGSPRARDLIAEGLSRQIRRSLNQRKDGEPAEREVSNRGCWRR